MRKLNLPSTLLCVICIILCEFLWQIPGILAGPAPFINRFLPRRIPSSATYVLLEGGNFGNDTSQVTIIFTAGNYSLNPCSVVDIPFPSYLNCTFSSPRIFTNGVTYNVTVKVEQTTSNRRLLQIGEINISPPIIQDADIILSSRTDTYIYINALETILLYSAVSRFFMIKPPKNGVIVPSMISSGPGVIAPSIISSDTGYREFMTDKRVIYYPRPNFFGRDSFQIQALDSIDQPSFTATFNLSIPRVRTIHSQRIDSVPIDICTDNTCRRDGAEIIIRALPRGRLRIIEGEKFIEVPSAPYSTVISSKTRIDYIPPTGVDEIKTTMTYTNVSEDIDTTLIIYAANLRIYDFQAKTNESIRIPISLKCEFRLDSNAKLNYHFASYPDDSKGEFTHYDNSPPILDNTNLKLRDGSSRMYFTPAKNFTGIFEIGYYCTDAFGRTSSTAKITVAVKPVLQCRNKMDIQNTVTLTTKNLERDGVSIQFLSIPEEGMLLHPDLKGKSIQPGDVVQANEVQYVTKIIGGGLLGGNVTYRLVNRFNDTSDPCTLQFIISCAPLYLNVFDSSTSNSCIGCPLGATCRFNGDRTPHAAPGYWYSQAENVYLSCVPATACPGEGNEICAEGYRGIRCGECATNFYKLNNQCVRCNEIEAGFVILIVACLISGIYLVYLFWTLVGKIQGLGLINIICNFIQTTLILRNINMNWPREIEELLNYFSIFNFNLELSSPECLVHDYIGFSTKMRLVLSIPIIFWGVLIITVTCRTDSAKQKADVIIEKVFHLLHLSERLWVRKINPRPMSDKPKRNQASKNADIIITFNASLSLVYITVSTYSLALFDCTKENDGFYYLDSDPSLRCYDDWWYSDLPLSIFALIFYVIGIPVYLGLILYFSRNDPLGGRKWIRIKKLCTSITANDNSYKPNRKENTFFQIFQKLVLVVVSMFFTRYISFQIIITVYMLMISFYVTVNFRPYVHESLNYLEIYSVGSNIVILTLGLLFYNNQLPPGLKATAINFILAIFFGFFVAVIVVAGFELRNKLKRNMSQGNQTDEPGSAQKILLHPAGLHDVFSTSRRYFGGLGSRVSRSGTSQESTTDEVNPGQSRSMLSVGLQDFASTSKKYLGELGHRVSGISQKNPTEEASSTTTKSMFIIKLQDFVSTLKRYVAELGDRVRRKQDVKESHNL